MAKFSNKSFSFERLMPTIRIIRGPFKGYKKILLDKSFSIGRVEDNDYSIRDINVTSKHCLIRRTEEGSFELFDNSINGTWVNGQKVCKSGVILRNKATIGIGPVLFMFEFVPE